MRSRIFFTFYFLVALSLYEGKREGVRELEEIMYCVTKFCSLF